MLRRNFFYACFGFGLSVLIFTGSRYTCNVNYQPPTENLRNEFTHFKTEGKEGLLQPIFTDPYEGPPNIEKILDISRAKIKLEFLNYNLTNFGANKLEDLILETEGNPIRTVIISTWRSGSTFFGELLDAMPGNFYHYEPLLHYGVIRIFRGTPHADDAIKNIKQLLKCDYSGMDDYFKYRKMHMWQLNHTKILWDHCKHKEELCFDANFTARLCKLFPVQSMKIVRVRLSLIEDILEDKELNIKVILLLRDPRGVMQSRRHLEFCQRAPDCRQPELLCADMVSNYVAAGRLIQKYPDRLMVLRYEELALRPKETTHQLLKFVRLGAIKSSDEFLHTHTNVKVAGFFSTFKVSRDMPFRWNNILTYSHVEDIQKVCKGAMSLWGYKLANNATHMMSKEFNPLEPYTITQ